MPEPLTVLQVIPRMRAGGAELGCLQIATALVKAGHRAIVASEGGQLVEPLEAAGRTHHPAAGVEEPAHSGTERRAARCIDTARRRFDHSCKKPGARVECTDRGAAHRHPIRHDLSFRLFREGAAEKSLQQRHGAQRHGHRRVGLHGASDPHPLSDARKAHRHHSPGLRRYGVRSGKLTPERIAAVRALLNADGTKPVLLLAGRITPRKAQHHLVTALGLLKERGAPAVVCVLAGEIEKPEFKAELEAQALRLGVGDQLRFPGHVRDMAAAYSITDISLNISEQEGLPRVAIEAQAMGVPMIVSDTGPGREVALTEPDVSADEASGLRVPYANPQAVADAIEAMLNWPPEKRKAYGQRGSAHVRSRFTLQQFMSKTLDVYKGLQRRSPV